MENFFSAYWWLCLAVSAVIVALIQALKSWDKAGKLKGWYTVFDVGLCAIGAAVIALAGLTPWAGVVLVAIVLGFLSTVGYQSFVKPWIDKGVKG